MRQELTDKELCGCGSDSIYAKCCKKKRVRYVRDGWGRIHKEISLDENGIDAFREAHDDFKKTFGRVPGRRDRILTGAYRYSPADFERMFLEVAAEAKTPKHLVYAYKKTGGLIVTPYNEDLGSPQDIQEYREAIDEYLEALDDGIDLLDPPDTLVSSALAQFSEYLESAVVHIGNFADKAPRAVRTNLPLFFQFLLLSRCHQVLKAIADRWLRDKSEDSIAAVRTIYECSLIINRLEFDPGYSETLLAQALNSSDLYQFRTGKNGKVDFSTIVEKSTKKKFESRTSFFKCASHIGERHVEFFNIAYPILSANVHFDSLGMLQRYRQSGSFLMWEDKQPEAQALIILTILMYLFVSICTVSKIQKTVKADAYRILKRTYSNLFDAIDAIEFENGEVEASLQLLIIRAMELLTDRDFVES